MYFQHNMQNLYFTNLSSIVFKGFLIPSDVGTAFCGQLKHCKVDPSNDWLALKDLIS